MTQLIESILLLVAGFWWGRVYERWQIKREKRRQIANNRTTTFGGMSQ